MKAKLDAGFVALAVDCDHPDPAVRALGAAHMSHARMLPFVLFLDADGKFLEGSEGGLSKHELLQALERVSKK